MIGACSKHEENREKEKYSIEKLGEKEHIRNLNLAAHVFTMYRHVQKN
jgi:hypothetical protein